MCSESIKQRIADLRDSAKKTRIAAQYADRTDDMRRDLADADKLDAEAKALERELQSGEQP